MEFPKALHNRTSYTGAIIAALSFIVFVFLVLMQTIIGGGHAPYAGLLIFVLAPALILFGLLLIPLGALFEWRAQRRTGRPSLLRFPVLDFNTAATRNAMFGFTVVALLVVFLSVFASYQAFEATESVSFCGELCHSVMTPEYTTYQHSPHARVVCVDCHVGPGADWYVRSKLSGLYQVYAVLSNRVPRPIPVPIHNLRPAQDTCEQCHWPQQFFGAKQKKITHFLPDEQNSPWEIDLLIKIGGGRPGGQAEGIHWHMNIENRVEYIATDEKREEIPWVRITNVRTGEHTDYAVDGAPAPTAAGVKLRKMDCMDCHNRPTHIYRSPSAAVNLAMANGAIDATLPSIKNTAVTLLAADYTSTDEALRAIDDGVTKFFEAQSPELLRTRPPAIAQAVTTLQDIYRDNFFPQMKARWDVYHDNIGHLVFTGCFRCHDGEHKSSDGRVITKDCTSCHVITGQGVPGQMEYSMDPAGLPFKHPQEIGDSWLQMKCNDCHTGAAP